MAGAAVEPMTLVGFAELQDSGGVLVYVAALSDPHIRVEGDNIICPDLNQVLGIYAGGATITEARLTSPSILRIFEHQCIPLNVGAEPLSPLPYQDMFLNPIPLVVSEPVRARIIEAVAGAEWEQVLIWLGAGPRTPVTLPYRTVRAVNTSTLVANAWTNVALTFDQTLPAGVYQIIGMKAFSAGCLAARLVIPGYAWRPGVIGCDALGDIDPLRFRFGNMGILGQFRHDSPPTVDFLSVSADTDQRVWLDLVGPL